MLKIYFTASTSVQPEIIERYKQIYKVLKEQRVELLSGKQVVNTKLLSADKKLTPEEIFIRQKGFIDASDLIVAEVTRASHGVGGEIAYALSQGIPVLALIHAGDEDLMSPMIAGNPSDRLFLDYYTVDNVGYKIKEFVQHIISLKKRKGKFIVIDGGDGSGKTTQASMLVAYLKKNKIPVKYFDFPQYYQSFHGKTVAKFLRGEFGDIKQVSPYLASLAYALDRASVKHEMEDVLKKGGYIIANRYMSSNLAHQGAKFEDTKEREDYIKWVTELEYKVHKIPQEDLVIYLYVPWEISAELVKKRGGRKYLKGKTEDIHEKDAHHKIDAQEMYVSLAKRYPHWVMVNCVKDGAMKSVEEIHADILRLLKEKKII